MPRTAVGHFDPDRLLDVVRGTGVDFAEAPKAASRLGGLERNRDIGLPGLSEPEAVRHYTRLSRQNYAVVAAAIEASGRVRRPDSRRTLEFALYAERSVLREAVLFGEGWGEERRWSDARIAAETVRMLASYLGLEPRAPRSPGTAARDRAPITRPRPACTPSTPGTTAVCAKS